MDVAMLEVEEQPQMELQLPERMGDGDGDMAGVPLVGNEVVSDGMEGTGPLVGDAGHAEMRRPNQLTLSFQGQVFVFDSVSTEKVQSVLLFLGGQELPREAETVLFHQNRWVLDDVPRSLNNSDRQASLMRFREKRKDRYFEKKIRYHVRKEVAQRYQHSFSLNPQFVIGIVSSGEHKRNLKPIWGGNGEEWLLDAMCSLGLPNPSHGYYRHIQKKWRLCMCLN